MARNTDKSMSRVLGKRTAQIALVGAVAATPLALGTGVASADTDWDAVAQCESGGDWSTDTGNGFSGGLQFTPSTWSAFGGEGSPEGASRAEQIAVAERVKAEQGMNAWPTCSDKTGQTDNSPNSGSGSSTSSSDEGSASSSDTGSSSNEDTSSSNEQSSSDESTPTPSSAPAQPGAPAAGTYTVAAGDTLSSIASERGTTVAALAQENGLADPDSLDVGQTLTMS